MMISSRPVRAVSLLVLAIVLLVSVRGFSDAKGTSGHSAQAREPRSSTGVVVRVLDGDTVEVNVPDQGMVRVRLLGVDAPEIEHPDKAGECYGHESSRALSKQLPEGTRVKLLPDPTQDPVDVYGRWLRYVHLDGRDVGRAQIRSGGAGVLESGLSVSRVDAYRRVEQRARDQRRGMWTSCP